MRDLNKHISGQFSAELESGIRTQVMTMGGGMVEQQLSQRYHRHAGRTANGEARGKKAR